VAKYQIFCILDNVLRYVQILCFEFLNMITAWCWTKEQEISDQFWEHCKYNLLNFSPVLFFLMFFWLNKTKKRIAIKNLENSYQERQTGANSRNILIKFKDSQRFFAGTLSELIFLNVFFDSICFLTTKNKNCHQKFG
jgi:hypothetical protein